MRRLSRVERERFGRFSDTVTGSSSTGAVCAAEGLLALLGSSTASNDGPDVQRTHSDYH